MGPAAGTGQGRRPTALPSPLLTDRLCLRRFLWAKGNPVPAGSSGTHVTTRAGGHSWAYFNALAGRALRFLDAGLAQEGRRLL